VKPSYQSHSALPAPHRPHAPRHPEHPHAAPPVAYGHLPTNTRLARFLGRNWARVGYAYHVEPTWLEINRFTLPVRGLAPGLRGLKIAHLTDFHCGNQIPAGYLEDALARTSAERPDAVALTGDFVHKGFSHVGTAAKLVRQLKAPLGVFAVLGNHDYSVRNALGIRRHPELHRAVGDALAAEGVRVLRNEAVRIDRPGGGLIVAGVNDLWSRECDAGATLGASCPDTPRVVLAHNPQSVELFGDHRADLVLSGHTHGGQVNWPGLGRVLLGKKAKLRAAGLYPHGSGHVYVNKGVGFGWRFRFAVRPEVAVFTLVPAE